MCLSSPEAALEEIAAVFPRREDLELILRQPGEHPDEEARYRGAGLAARCVGRHVSVRVPGPPDWELLAGSVEGDPPDAGLLDRAVAALGAWRAARVELARAESRLTLRTQELDLLQRLGRIGAEARTAAALFSTAANLLVEGAGADLVMVGHALGGGFEALAYLGRPVAMADLAALAERARGAAGASADAAPGLAVAHLDGFDASAARREGLREEDAVVMRIERRGRAVAGLVVVAPGHVGERNLRLFFGAANQLSLHLDRILTVQEAEQGRFRSILDSMPQAVFLTDRALGVIHLNPAAARLVGRLTPSAQTGRIARVGDLDLAVLAAQVLEENAPSEGAEVALPGGTVLSVTVSPLAAAGGSPEGLVVVATDVTEGRRLQAQLAQSEKLSSLGEMISGIAHELNNPLSSVLGYAQLAQASPAEAKLAGRLEVIHREARRCQRIVQNLLSFARRYEPERRAFSLNEVVESVLGLLAYQIRVGDVRIEKHLDRDLPAILGDPHQLQQAILNLVSNAYQAIRGADRDRGVIRVRTSRVGPDFVALELQDDGPGIPASIRTRIFDPFFTTKAPGQGTGLGLSLVYGAVTAHGGTIDVDSDEGQGATFRIVLPVRKAEVAETPAPGGTEPRGPALHGRILVVDDEPTVAGLICEALAAEGHTTVAVGNGREALDRIAREEFDLVLTDLKMPGMGGDRLFREILRLKPGITRRVLLTTGDTVSREPEAFAREAGLDLLHKPFDVDDLRRAVAVRLRAARGA